MGSKLLVIIATGEKEKALTGIMYAGNALKRNWMDDTKIVFFGPSERLIVEDEQVYEKAKELTVAGECFACKAISDKEGISVKLEKLGAKVEYVGSIISQFIKDGYTPMVW
jgi:hypothetical protein